MDRIPIALIGAGQVVRDQHVPVLAASDEFELVGAVSPYEELTGWPTFTSMDELLARRPDVQAVAVCTPPQVRSNIARQALELGLHVMLEKPPCPTVAEAEALAGIAATRQLALFAAWHSRAARAVAEAKRLLAGRELLSVEVRWHENVRELHPGQAWLWQDGGLGVFDPGINALSIVTAILPGPIRLDRAELAFPSNCETPIAASLELTTAHGTPVKAELDFHFAGPMAWEIDIDSGAGRLLLSKGGAVLHVDGEAHVEAPGVAYANLHAEYASLYATFAGLVRERAVDVDCEPLRLVAEALATGKRRVVEAFVE